MHCSGSLFRGKTKVKDGWIDGAVTIDGKNKDLFFGPDNDYALQCFHYIHENPVKASLVKVATDWPYSSARDYAGLRNGKLCNQELERQLLETGHMSSKLHQRHPITTLFPGRMTDLTHMIVLP